VWGEADILVEVVQRPDVEIGWARIFDPEGQIQAYVLGITWPLEAVRAGCAEEVCRVIVICGSMW